MGEESGREPAGRGERQARRRWAAVRRVAGRVAEGLAVEAVRAAVSVWAPEWSDVTPLLETAVQLALRLRRGRGGRPRG
uniref:SLV.1B n=1 Tax=Streptomyces lavendulae TaxID=1914 RepID=Q6RGR9_STRLA|nr:SLV.1B [Streptomyces lavendulae]